MICFSSWFVLIIPHDSMVWIQHGVLSVLLFPTLIHNNVPLPFICVTTVYYFLLIQKYDLIPFIGYVSISPRIYFNLAEIKANQLPTPVGYDICKLPSHSGLRGYHHIIMYIYIRCIKIISLWVSQDPFCQDGLTLIPSWISNHMASKVWGEIIHTFPSINGCTVVVWELICNFMHGCNRLSMMELKLINVSERIWCVSISEMLYMCPTYFAFSNFNWCTCSTSYGDHV